MDTKSYPLLPVLLRRMHLTDSIGGHPEAGIRNTLTARGVDVEKWDAYEESTPIPTVDEVISLMGFDSPAVNELAAYLLMNGEVYGFYGRVTWHKSLIHTLICGVDWSKSTGPQNATWASFVDTFTEPRDESATSIKLECLCGDTTTYYDGCEVGITTFNVAHLLSFASGSFRDKT